MHIIAAEDESVQAQERAPSVPGNKFKIKDAIELVLVYERQMIELAKLQMTEANRRNREQKAIEKAQRDEQERQAELARQAKQH